MFNNKDTLNLKRLKKGGGMEKVLQLGPLFSLVKKIYKKKEFPETTKPMFGRTYTEAKLRVE